MVAGDGPKGVNARQRVAVVGCDSGPPPSVRVRAARLAKCRFVRKKMKRAIPSDTEAIAASFVVSGLILGLGMITGVVLARSLGPQARGELAAILLWPSLLAALGSLGVADAVLYHAARRSDPLGTIVGTSLLIALAQSLILGIGALLVVPAVLSLRGIDAPITVYLSLLYIPLFLVTDYLIFVLAGIQRLSWFQALRLSWVVISAAMLTALWLTGGLSVRSAVLVYLATFALIIAVASVLVIPAGGLRLRYSHQLAKSLLSFGIKSHLSTASGVLNQRVDQLVISVFLAPTALGTYVVAVAISSVPAVVGSAIALVVFPRVARLQAGRARDAMARRTVQLTLFTATVIAVVLMVTVHWLVGFLVGSAYRDAVNIARVLIVASVFLGMSSTLTALLKAVGRPLQAGLGASLALLVTVAGLILLVPPYGLMGAAVVSLAAYAVSATFMLQRAARELELPIGALLFPRDSGHLLVSEYAED